MRLSGIYVFLFSVIQFFLYHNEAILWNRATIEYNPINKKQWSLVNGFFHNQCHTQQIRVSANSYLASGSTVLADACMRVLDQWLGHCYVFTEYDKGQMVWMVRCGSMDDECVTSGKYHQGCSTYKVKDTPYRQKSY
tara:strand:+ start:857 stop:1267 length:411 start_codon:yes stop_codon:yes gene_type:complete